MCNIAGYIGTEQAAPILIEMIRKTESFNGGCYSGIATIHEGKLYYAKLTGSVDRLAALTEAASMPGTIGILHSRTPNGGGDEWAHPFVALRDGVPEMAYVANGSVRHFAKDLALQTALAEELLGQGYPMAKLWEYEGKPYLLLKDGSTVHMSDAMCRLIQRWTETGLELPSAMEEAFCQMPAEIVGLALSVKEPDHIAWSRINAPMFVAFSSHGAYLASTAMAMPEDAQTEPWLLPACSGGKVMRDSFTASAYKKPPVQVGFTDSGVRARAWELLTEQMKKEPTRFADLTALAHTAYTGCEVSASDALTYEILTALDRQGVLKIEARHRDGVREGVDAAPLNYMSL